MIDEIERTVKAESATEALLTTARRFGQLQRSKSLRQQHGHDWLPDLLDDIPNALIRLCAAAEDFANAEAGNA